MPSCQHCQHDLPEGMLFCGYCGTALEAQPAYTVLTEFIPARAELAAQRSSASAATAVLEYPAPSAEPAERPAQGPSLERVVELDAAIRAPSQTPATAEPGGDPLEDQPDELAALAELAPNPLFLQVAQAQETLLRHRVLANDSAAPVLNTDEAVFGDNQLARGLSPQYRAYLEQVQQATDSRQSVWSQEQEAQTARLRLRRSQLEQELGGLRDKYRGRTEAYIDAQRKLIQEEIEAIDASLSQEAPTRQDREEAAYDHYYDTVLPEDVELVRVDRRIRNYILGAAGILAGITAVVVLIYFMIVSGPLADLL